MADDPPKVFKKEVTTTIGQKVDVTKAMEKMVVVETPIESLATESNGASEEPAPAVPDIRAWSPSFDQPSARPRNHALLNDPQTWVPSPQVPIPASGGSVDDGTHQAIQNIDAARRRNINAQHQPSTPLPLVDEAARIAASTAQVVQLEARSSAMAGGSAVVSVTPGTSFPVVPDQSPAPVRVEERDGKIARASDRDSPLRSAEADFNAWREPIIDHARELLAGDFRQGTNHGRARDRLIALDTLLSGNLDEVKDRQFRIGYEIERLEGLVAAYRSSGDDMPALTAGVLEDLDRLRLALKIGIGKLERWADFRLMAAGDPWREGDANPAVVGEALEEIAAVMERQPKYFEPELPATFRFLAEAVKDPAGANKTVVYGSVRSAENLISFLGQKALGVATKAADAVEQHISKAVAAFLISGLTAAALQISGSLPAGWPWLKPLLDALVKAGGS